MNRLNRKYLLSGAVLGLLLAPGWSSAEPANPRNNPIGMEYADALQATTPDAENPTPEAAQPHYPKSYKPVVDIHPKAIDPANTNPLYAVSPAELDGQQVLGIDDEPLGQISAIVSDRVSGQIHVIIASGGLLGWGASHYAIPLDSLDRVEQQLYLQSTRSELKNREEYHADGYVAVVPENRPISEFSAIEEAN